MPVTEISRADAERLSDTRTPQGVFAVIEDQLPEATTAIERLPSGTIAVALDSVQDPGNVGAIIRSAAAFGCQLVLLGPGCADATHPRATRAATGAWFQVPIARSSDLAADLARLRERGARVIAANSARDLDMERAGRAPLSRDAAAPPKGGSDSDRCAGGTRVFVFGNEGAGLSAELEAVVDEIVSIPMGAGVESLNVAVAAGIILWQASQLEGA